MKKTTCIFIVLFALTWQIFAQCTSNTEIKPIDPVTIYSSGDSETIGTIRDDTYSILTGIVDGLDYIIESSDSIYVTITQSDGSTVIAHGQADPFFPLSNINTGGTGEIRVYWNDYSGDCNTFYYDNIQTSITAQITCGAPFLEYPPYVTNNQIYCWFFRSSSSIGTAVGYNWEIQNRGVAPGTSPAVASGSTTSKYATSGPVLTPNTPYDLYLQTNCGANGNSTWIREEFSTTNTPVTTPSNCSAYTSAPNATITNRSFITDVISVTGTGTDAITNLKVAVNISHNRIGDLNITLQSPAGTVVNVMQNQCGFQKNMYIEFNDAGNSFQCGTPTVGVFQPSNGALSAFNGETFTGNWTLRVQNNYDYDGTLVQWCLLPEFNNTLNMQEALYSSNFLLYPNPAQNKITLQATATIQDICVYNILGQSLIKLQPNQASVNLNTGNLPTGAYFIKAIVNGVSTTKRFVKE